MESTSYVVRSLLPDVVFLTCDHRLDFLHRVNIVSEFNQSINQSWMRSASHTQLANNFLCPLLFLFVFVSKDVAFFRVFSYHRRFLLIWRVRRAV